MEELYESDVMWPESYSCSTAASTGSRSHLDTANHARSRCSGTSPVNIPSARRRGGEEPSSWRGCTEVVPPHVLVSRRRAEGEMAFSLCSGAGRTLKGRDLRHVRDSVLRMTGFIES